MDRHGTCFDLSPAGHLMASLEPSSLLIERLRHFDRFSTVAYIGSLLTIPALHANELRIETLVRLASIHCNGRDQLSRSEVSIWLNDLMALTPIPGMEDPPEDVFILNIRTARGNYRTFAGLWDNLDFYLQETIDVLFTGAIPPGGETLRETLFALLRLSEATADRLQLARWMDGGGEPTVAIDLPSESQISDHTNAILFTVPQLAELGIAEANLSAFVTNNSGSNISEPEPLELKPLLKLGDCYVLALPTAVSSAVCALALEWLGAHGFLSIFQATLRRK
jgi:hypothetical protein